MKVFRKKLEQAYPVIQVNDRVMGGGLVKHTAALKNRRIEDQVENLVPYIGKTVEYLKQKKGVIPQRILLVTENENVALKSAVYIKEHLDDYQMNLDGLDSFFDDFDDFDDMEDEDETEEQLRVVPLRLRKGLEQNLINEYVMLLSGVGSGNAVFFTGLHGNCVFTYSGGLKGLGANRNLGAAFLSIIIYTFDQLLTI